MNEETRNQCPSVENRLKTLYHTIEKKSRTSSLSAPNITIVAVTKKQGIEKIKQVLSAGHRVFGENKVQEAEEKWPEIKKKFPDVQLHLIGQLQRNKVKRAFALFDVIETLDSEKLALSIDAQRKQTGHCPQCYIQVNTGEEPQKGGILPADVDDFIHFTRVELALPIEGLMCIPPFSKPAAPHFAFLREIARSHYLKKLSMGMSRDYEEAILFGATSVRIGTEIFGLREEK